MVAREAVKVHRTWRAGAASLTERSDRDEAISPAFDVIVDAASRGPVDIAALFADVEGAHAVALLDAIAEARQGRPRSIALEAAYRDLSGLKARASEDGSLQGQVEEAEREYEQAEAQERGAFATGEPVGLDAAQAWVDGAQATVIELYVTGERTLALVLRPGQPVQELWMNTGRGTWVSAVADLRDALANGRLSEHDPEAEITRVSALLGPLVPSLPTSGPLVIVPHGPLHELPWAALRTPEGAPYPALATAPSLSTLIRLTEERPTVAVKPFVAFRASDQLTVRRSTLDTIQRRIDPRGAALDGSTAEDWKAVAPRAAHILVLSHGAGAYGGDGWIEVPAEPDHPPRLYASEIADIRLPAAELVVLAACDASAGQVSFSDDRFDLARALLQAGAVAVLAPIWKIPDTVDPQTGRKPTEVFLQAFYDAYITPEGGLVRKDEALFAAQAQLREQGWGPEVWAAWVVVGDGR